jgi:SAM-dependent methyltransferase
MFFKKRAKGDKKAAALAARYPNMIVPDDHPDRQLDAAEAKALLPGGAHYRAYVGPPDRFDFMSLTQMALLFHMGVREHHKVLDFGCGSLRLGRMLIPLLKKGHYFGIDPNPWLIEDGFKHELGQDIRALKAPRFDHNTEFNCDAFGESFDYIIAQSIVTHTGPKEAQAIISSAKACLKPGGIFLFNYIAEPQRDTPPADGWYYPECIGFTPDMMMVHIENAGLKGVALPWFHPTSAWLACAHDANELPTVEQMRHLTGAVLRDEQFAHSQER